MRTSAKPAAQATPARKTATAKAKPANPFSDTRLLSKAQVLAVAGVTYPTLWTWMRNGTFPRSRVAGGRSMWLSTEVEAWLAALPIRPLKGDAATRAAIERLIDEVSTAANRAEAEQIIAAFDNSALGPAAREQLQEQLADLVAELS